MEPGVGFRFSIFGGRFSVDGFRLARLMLMVFRLRQCLAVDLQRPWRIALAAERRREAPVAHRPGGGAAKRGDRGHRLAPPFENWRLGLCPSDVLEVRRAAGTVHLQGWRCG